MKKIITIAALACGIAIPAAAQSSKASIVIVFTDHGNISATMDGRVYDDKNDVVVIDNVTPGIHKVKVCRPAPATAKNARPAVIKELTVDVARNSTTTFTMTPDGSSVEQQKTQYSGMMVHKAAEQTEEETVQDNEEPGNTDRVMNDPAGDKEEADDPEDTEEEEHQGHHNQQALHAGNTSGQVHKPVGKRTEDEAEQGKRLTGQDLTAINLKAHKKKNDAAKTEVMQAEIGERTCTTAQVRMMLRWLQTEAARLEFAKWAYEHVSDAAKYQQLATEFKLAPSREELKNLPAAQGR